jgi:hypothetical protein
MGRFYIYVISVDDLGIPSSMTDGATLTDVKIRMVSLFNLLYPFL